MNILLHIAATLFFPLLLCAFYAGREYEMKRSYQKGRQAGYKAGYLRGASIPQILENGFEAINNTHFGN